MTRDEFNLLYEIKKHGLPNYRKLSDSAGFPIENASQSIEGFMRNGLIDDSGITGLGLEALHPYKVENAVIMAAGMSRRFVPLSLEKPKGLLKVKGEILIERQIEQLQAAGIKDIILIVGYKKESFYYLKEKYEGIRIIINPEYDTKNNTHTIYLAQEYLSNSYICSSDNYFAVDPFEEYVYQSYYAAQHISEESDEWFMYSDPKGNITRVEIGGTYGDIMLGHVYWDREFTSSILEHINRSHETGEYDQALWEQILLDHVDCLPPMYVNVYPDGSIFEFDTLDELRSFDDEYVDNTHSKIMKRICSTMKCKEKDIVNCEAVKDESADGSFVFEVNNRKYVYHHSGEQKGNITLWEE